MRKGYARGKKKFLVMEERDILECKRSDATSWKEKTEHWKNLAALFYQITGVERDWPKSKLEKMKERVQKAKKKTRLEV